MNRNTPSSRRIFFWSLVATFFIIVSVVLFFAFGYRFNRERGIFVYAGSLTIKSAPQKVEIFIDGSKAESERVNLLNGSYHMNGLRPGTHLIEVRADGFIPWSKKITITSGRSTEFWNVLLVRNTYDRTSYDEKNISRFFLSPRDNLVALVENVADVLRVSVIEEEKSGKHTIFSSSVYTFTPDPHKNIEWSPDAKHLLIPAADTVEKTPHATYILVDVDGASPYDMARSFPKDVRIRDARWDPEKKSLAYILANTTLYHIDARKQDAPPEIFAEDVLNYDFTNDGVYILSTTGTLYRNTSGNPSQRVQLGSTPVDLADPTYRVIAYDSTRVALLNNRGDLYLYNEGENDTSFSRIAEHINGLHFSNDGKKLLYWSDWELFVFFTRQWETQPLRSEGEHFVLTRFSQKIDNVHWGKSFEHVLFTVGNAITVIGLDHRDRRFIETITTFSQEKSFVVSDHSDNQVFFLDTTTDGTLGLFSIIFPEEIGFLGFGT